MTELASSASSGADPRAATTDLDVPVEWHCVLAGKRFAIGRPVVGDEVRFATLEHDRGVIVELLPRRSLIERATAASRRPLPIAANVDTLLIVASTVAPPLRTGLIDRYLCSAFKLGIEPVLCVNKWDLAVDDDDEILAEYEPLGLDILRCSARSGLGIEALAARLAGHQSVFVGHSGVGKSSLLNALLPDAKLTTGEISVVHCRGKHTTTHATLLRLAGGGFVVDTPGIREFGLVGIHSDDLGSTFPEFIELAPRCRFQPCSHSHEPDCAVQAAADEGRLSGLRYESYVNLYLELRELEAGRYD